MKKRWKSMISSAFAFTMLAASALGTSGLTVQAETVDTQKNLIAYFDFDTAELTNLAEGSSYTAEYVGSGVAYDANGGISGGSANYTKQANSYLKIGQCVNTAQKDYTIAAWVKYDADTFADANVNLFQQNGNGRTVLYLKTDLTYGTYMTAKDYLCEKTVALDTWHHVAVTTNHTTKTVQFYINGALVNEEKMEGSYADALTDLLIGQHKNGQQAGGIKGDVDELRVYDAVVDADVIAAVYDEYAAMVEISALVEAIAEAKAIVGNSDTDEAKALKVVLQEAEALVETKPDKEEIRLMMDEIEAAVLAYQDAVSIKISVDTDTVEREISDAMFGINHRYHNNGYSSWNVETDAMEKEFNELAKEASFGSVRYPGGTVSNLFDWKRAIGPTEDRIATIHGNTKTPIEPNFGVDEAMSWVYDELEGEAVWVYGMGQGTAADACDLFEYLNAPADGDATNVNDGIDWAEVRKENGHEEPYGVTRWEIGNEFGYWGQDYWMTGGGSRNKLEIYTNGGTMTFNNVPTAQLEDWRDAAANSNGRADQVRYLKYAPINEGSAHIYVGGTEWTIADSLEGQGKKNVCTLDYATGKVVFGNGTDGNIPASGAAIKASYTSDCDGFIEYYKQLKATAAELDMEIQVYSCMEKYGNLNFPQLMAQQGTNEFYDGVVIHPYSDTTSIMDPNSANFYENILGRSLSYNMTRVQQLADHLEQYAPGEGKVPVLSEFGIYKHNASFIRGLGHAIYIANEMIDYVNFGTPYINKHCLVDYPYGADDLGAGDQCVIQALSNGNGYDFVSTPSAKMFSIFNNMTGSQQVTQTVEGNTVYYTYEGYEVPTIKTIASTDEEGNTYVTVVNNRKGKTTKVEIAIDDRDVTGDTFEVWYLTSENVTDENTLANPNKVDVVKTDVTAEEDTLTYVLEPNSITSFKLSKEDILEPTPTPTPDPEPTPTPGVWMNPFKDVADDKWYYDAVAWGEQTDVVTGLTADTFGVGVDCTRGQIVTFIWRAMDEPEAVEKTHCFVDVEEGKYYYEAMLWAVEEGIVTGLTDTTFGPKEICTRGQMATLLYRLAGEPEVGTEIPFPDVKPGKWYTNATIWAAEEGIVTGYTDGTFGYNDTVSREQTITMLYRYFVK